MELTSTTAYRPAPVQTYIAREGYPFVAIALMATLLLWFTGLPITSTGMGCVTAFIAFFFRNPERKCPEGEGLVICPADGRVLSVTHGVKAPCTDAPAIKISIFMSLFDVHMNRSPIAAKVRSVQYSPGSFFVASLDKASEKNERNAIVLQDGQGRALVMVQIAGIIARRIVCYVREGDELARAIRCGIIRFGSRVDLYLPTGSRVDVAKGHRVRAGESIMGRLP